MTPDQLTVFTRVKFSLQQATERFWQQTRRPMVRFGLFVLVGLSLMGYGCWQLWREFRPDEHATAEVAAQSDRTALQRLLRPDESTSQPKRELARQWISCSDVRRVLFDVDRKYIGCRGGVLVVGLDGKILKQYSQADGLTNHIVTDLQLIGQKLFVGSQDGVSVIDLATDVITPLRQKEGLVNGSNVTLTSDGDMLWVGTFDGVSRIDPKTLAITNYKTELLAEATKFSVHRIATTPKAVYISLISSAYSPGGLVRYDKKTGTLTQLPSQRFPRKTTTGDAPTSINYLNVAAIGDLLLLQDGELFWSARDSQNLQPVSLPALTTQIKQMVKAEYLSNIEIIGTLNEEVVLRTYADSTEFWFMYAPKAKTLREMAPQDPLYTEVVKLAQARPSLQTDESVGISSERPTGFGQLLAAVDGSIWFSATDGIWTLKPKEGEFTRRVTWPDEVGTPDQIWMAPIVGTNTALIARQICGMGCIQPEFWLISWPDQKIQPLTLPEDLKAAFQNQVGDVGALDYASVPMPKIEVENKQLVFALPTATVAFQPTDQKWHILSENPTPALQVQPNTLRCHPLYSFNSSANALQETQNGCPNEMGSLRVGDYAFLLGGLDDQVADDWLADGAGKKLAVVPADEPIYSPFEGWGDYVSIRAAWVDQDSVWLAHNRGIARYIPITNTWELDTSKTGLAGSIVEDMIVTDDYIVALTGGGLSVVPKLPASIEAP